MISVIVPIYNIKEYLPHCLNSILSQTYQDIEVILIDDGSTDGSSSLCDEYCIKDERIKVFHQNNQGVSAARNKGLEVASGEYISFIDGDDCIHPLMLETLYKCFKDRKCDLAMVEAKVSSIIHNYPNLSPSSAKTLNQENVIKRLFSESTQDWQYITVLNKLYPRHLLKGLVFSGEFGEDLLFNSHIYLRINTLAFVDTVMYYYVQRPNSLLHTSVKKGFYINDIKTLFKIYTFFPKDKPQYRAYCLHKTYKRILSASYYAKGISLQNEVQRISKKIKKQTLNVYKSSPHIPIKDKMVILIFLRCPLLYKIFRWIGEKRNCKKNIKNENSILFK